MTNQTTMCEICTQAAADGIGAESDIQTATVKMVVDGEAMNLCDQCEEVTHENAVEATS